ncbi:alpha/beta hydrolase [Hyunsoonleella pacifica]|uniref:Alpha/beta hydrolase n=1 Tax=Hyunsoonleella pacifica TaxID=1080224 RepID=A0A4V2JAR3_9FLAO|nr:alpha/beta hydrolase [Hyunsoonleella pacifica]TBN14298.1 alpha/beta hydrolase [Hyunsoonleella pacifica]GGD12609.1 alpha/beta hydrolase [Hyunsoonleella pacifica]
MLNTPQNPIKRKLKKLAIVLLTLYVMISAGLYFMQEKLLFLPSVLEDNYQYEFNYDFEELNFKTDDGAVLNAIHFKVENPKGVILYFHGNAGDLSRWGKITEFFVEKDYDVLVMDYRTYGKSTGKLSENAFYSDAQLFYDFLKTKYNEGRITVYGRSLGTGIATYIASQNTPKQLILETPYYSMVDVGKHRFPFLPVETLLKYKFPTYQFIQNVTCPITMFHGLNDRVVPYKSAEKLFKVTPKGKGVLVTIDEANHSNIIEFKTYHNTIEELLP